MIRISRPYLDGFVFQKRLAAARDALPPLLETVNDRPYNVDLVLVKALEIARFGSVVEPNSPVIGKALLVAAQANAAIFAMACAGGQPVQLPLDNQRLLVPSPAIDYGSVEPGKWMQGFFLASLCRNEELLDFICKTPTDMLRTSSTKAPEYMYLFVDALRAFRAGAQDRTERILMTMRATDPNRGDIIAEDWTLYIDVYLLQLLFCLNGNDPEFDKALREALEQHREYWTKTQARAKDWQGFLPLGILGISAFAYDRGLHFDVDSDYLPMHLVRGDFLGKSL